ncbi:hypothetical protein QL285_013774 [Trifolium repens]|nr:hypothetical protein QL285_013774 [Trifolium repens]
MIRNYLDRRSRDAAQQEHDAAQRARDSAKQVRYEAQRERVTVSTNDTSNPSQFHQNECVICLQGFTNTQTYHTDVEHVMRLNENMMQLNEHVIRLNKYAMRLKERG